MASTRFLGDFIIMVTFRHTIWFGKVLCRSPFANSMQSWLRSVKKLLLNKKERLSWSKLLRNPTQAMTYLNNLTNKTNRPKTHPRDSRVLKLMRMKDKSMKALKRPTCKMSSTDRLIYKKPKHHLSLKWHRIGKITNKLRIKGWSLGQGTWMPARRPLHLSDQLANSWHHCYWHQDRTRQLHKQEKYL